MAPFVDQVIMNPRRAGVVSKLSAQDLESHGGRLRPRSWGVREPPTSPQMEVAELGSQDGGLLLIVVRQDGYDKLDVGVRGAKSDKCAQPGAPEAVAVDAKHWVHLPAGAHAQKKRHAGGAAQRQEDMIKHLSSGWRRRGDVRIQDGVLAALASRCCHLGGILEVVRSRHGEVFWLEHGDAAREQRTDPSEAAWLLRSMQRREHFRPVMLEQRVHLEGGEVARRAWRWVKASLELRGGEEGRVRADDALQLGEAHHFLVELVAVLRGVPATDPLEVALGQVLLQSKGIESGDHSLARLRERRALHEECVPHPLRLRLPRQPHEVGEALLGDGEVLRDDVRRACERRVLREGQHRVDAVLHQLVAVARGEEVSVHVDRLARVHLLADRLLQLPPLEVQRLARPQRAQDGEARVCGEHAVEQLRHLRGEARVRRVGARVEAADAREDLCGDGGDGGGGRVLAQRAEEEGHQPVAVLEVVRLFGQVDAEPRDVLPAVDGGEEARLRLPLLLGVETAGEDGRLLRQPVLLAPRREEAERGGDAEGHEDRGRLAGLERRADRGDEADAELRRGVLADEEAVEAEVWVLQPRHPLAEGRRDRGAGQAELGGQVDDVALEEVLEIWEDGAAGERALVGSQLLAQCHHVHHGGMQSIGDAQLQLNVVGEGVRLRTHEHTRHRAQLRRQHRAQVFDHEGLVRQRLGARHFGASVSVRGDPIDHRVVEDDVALQPLGEGLLLLALLREVAAEHMVAKRVAVEREVVRVEHRERRLLPTPRAEAAVEELGEREDGGAVVDDPRLGDPHADVPQLAQLLRQAEEGLAALPCTQRAAGGHLVVRRQHRAVGEHRVDFVRRPLAGWGGFLPRLHVLLERAAPPLHEDDLAAKLGEDGREHRAEEPAGAEAHGGGTEEGCLVKRGELLHVCPLRSLLSTHCTPHRPFWSLTSSCRSIRVVSCRLSLLVKLPSPSPSLLPPRLARSPLPSLLLD
mmetsp:Transcript_16399/g.37501  ORF Transcript_16399/g.37501 Transcript_16399/m.37501 type:complete len:978 (-) Transcript_16399:2-2935(-)